MVALPAVGAESQVLGGAAERCSQSDSVRSAVSAGLLGFGKLWVADGMSPKDHINMRTLIWYTVKILCVCIWYMYVEHGGCSI